MEMVQENSPDEVERATGAAISALPDLEKAVTLASKLRAVGPATASGTPPYTEPSISVAIACADCILCLSNSLRNLRLVIIFL